MQPLVDPRRGDIEDDASSTKSNSLLSMAGSLLGEISLAKLIVAWLILFIVPAVIVGLVPLIAGVWAGKLAGKLTPALIGIVPIALFVAVAAIGWLFGRRLFRLAESSFWSLNALVIEPAYTMCREALRHLAELALPEGVEARRRERFRSWSAVASGLLISALALWMLSAAWPASRWSGVMGDLLAFKNLAWVALANTVVVVSAYLAVAALVWGLADATMPPPRDLPLFSEPTPGARTWRVAHLSDVHVVGERYGFRIESGRSGAQGDSRFRRLLRILSDIHASAPLDVVLISGDATDAGRSGEWAEFLDALTGHPGIAARVLLLPGNHDVNIVDRANPARLDLSIGPNSRLRKIRTLSAIDAVQGSRVRVVDPDEKRIGKTLSEALRPHAAELSRFAATGLPYFSTAASDRWDDVFPMVVPPECEDGLGIILLNSNTDSHFSFTNALGMISAAQGKAMDTIFAQHPKACWLIGLHHHPVEYPRAAKVLSERIGTTLVNGNWFLRRLAPMAQRAILMHGHRHIDWIGECGGLVIVSAPSPVMESKNDAGTYFYIHTLEIGAGSCLRLLAPQRVDVPGEATNVMRTRDASGAPNVDDARGLGQS
jgi:predicted MPP superfamily phosphohydrolase